MSWLQNLFRRFKGERKAIDLSFSRVQAYSRCPWMYHLIYDLGWRSGPSGPAALGQSLHRALAAFLSGDNQDRSLNRLLEIYDAVWVNEGFSGTQETLDNYDAGRKMLEHFFEADKARTSTVIGTEKDFEIKLSDDLLFRGTLDRLDKGADGCYEVVEYKTRADHWTPSRTGADLQMTLYDLGVRKSFNTTNNRLKYFFLSTGESVTVRRTDDQRRAAEDLLKQVGAGIRGENFSPNHGHCSKCEFSTRCENFQKS